jgi:hypothetical protein
MERNLFLYTSTEYILIDVNTVNIVIVLKWPKEKFIPAAVRKISQFVFPFSFDIKGTSATHSQKTSAGESAQSNYLNARGK